MLISDKHINRIYEIGLILLAFSIPIYRKVVPYVIAVIVITWLLEADFVMKAKRIAENEEIPVLWSDSDSCCSYGDFSLWMQ